MSTQNDLVEKMDQLALDSFDDLQRYFTEPDTRDGKTSELVDKILKVHTIGIQRRSQRAREAVAAVRVLEASGVKTSGEGVRGILEHMGIDAKPMLTEAKKGKKK